MENSGGIQASLSGRYATALFELARDSKSLATVEVSLGTVRTALNESADFKALTSSPLISRAAAGKAVAAVARELQLDPTTTSFLAQFPRNLAPTAWRSSTAGISLLGQWSMRSSSRCTKSR